MVIPWIPRERSSARGRAGDVAARRADDGPRIARLLQIELTAAGFEVRRPGTGGGARARARAPSRSVVADVMMPTVDGFELTRRLRNDERTAATKVILLTARGLSEGKLEGFAWARTTTS